MRYVPRGFASLALLLLAPALVLAGSAPVLHWGSAVGTTEGNRRTALTAARDNRHYQAINFDNGGLPFDPQLICHTPDGVQLYWTHLGTDLTVRDLQVDPSGNAYVVGDQLQTGGTQLSFVVKVDRNGEVAWTQKLAPPSHYNSTFAITSGMDGFGNLFVGGITSGTSVPIASWIARISPSTGAPLWTHYALQTEVGQARRMTVGRDGHPVLGGIGAVGVGLMKCSSQNGARLWTYTARPGALHDLKGIVSDASGSIYVGAERRTNNQSSHTNDWWVFKLNSSGVAQWSQFLGGPFADYLHHIRVAPQGGVYVGGNRFLSGSLESLTPVLARYTASGSLAFTQVLPVTTPNRHISDLQVDGAGNPALLMGDDGRLGLAGFTSTGTLTWETLFDPYGPSGSLAPVELEIVFDPLNNHEKLMVATNDRTDGGTSITLKGLWVFGPPPGPGGGPL